MSHVFKTVYPHLLFLQGCTSQWIASPSIRLPKSETWKLSLILLFPSLLQFIISSMTSVSNTGRARMWGVSAYLVHEDTAFPLLFFTPRAQGGDVPQFKKVVFQEFTDGSFTQPLYRGELNEHLGLLGPYIRAEVEDNIMVSWGQWSYKKINPICIFLFLIIKIMYSHFQRILKYRK